MAKKITRINVRKLSNQELHSFCQRVMKIIKESAFESDTFYQAFVKAALDLGIALAKQPEQSRNLAELDRSADLAWRTLDMAIEVFVRHPSAQINEAALEVQKVFETIPNPTELNYDEEYGALTTLLERLETLDAAVLNAAMVEAYIEVLKDAVQAFKAAAHDNVTRQSMREVGLVKTCATAIYDAWQIVITQLELYARTDRANEVSPLIDALNTLNAKIKVRLRIREGKSNTKNLIEALSAEAE